MLYGCKPKENMQFCEGVSLKGEGVECGIQFGTGDITVIIKNNEPMGVNKLFVEIFEKGKKKETKVDTLVVEVKPADLQTTATLLMYKAGNYTVKALKGKTVISKGSIEIIDY